jgi:hypothetical protein
MRRVRSVPRSIASRLMVFAPARSITRTRTASSTGSISYRAVRST